MSRGPLQSMGGGGQVLDFFLRILVPAGVAVSLLAIFTVQGLRVDSDLHVVAPAEVAPGELLPLRAQVYAELSRPEGAVLISPKVEVELRGKTRADLRPGYRRTLEGSLRVPSDALGTLRLLARIRPDRKGESSGEEALISRTLRVVQEPKPLLPTERALPPLRQKRAEDVVSLHETQPPPNGLSVQIAGGVCVPEVPCELFVYVGTPAAALLVMASASVTPLPESARPSMETSGVARLRVVTHGPEAQLTLSATRGGVPVATRALRLSVALGADAVRGDKPLVSPRPQFGLYGEERGCIVDAFRDGRWLRTGSLRECRGRETLPFAPLTPGLWRLQLRRDPFSAESAGVRSVYVRGERERDTDLLRALSHAAQAEAPSNPLARSVQADPEAYASSVAETAGYLLALLDEGVILLPEPASSHPAALARQATTQAKVRMLALLALLLCALIVALSLAQRGRAAVTQAENIMTQAGQTPLELHQQALHMRLRLLASLCSLLLAFCAIAAYMIALTSR